MKTKNCFYCEKVFNTHNGGQKFCGVPCRETYNADVENGPSKAQIRFAVMARDRFRCFYCGKGSTEGVLLEVDHIVPRSKGGTDDVSNLVTACAGCNSAKRDSLFKADLLQELLNRVFDRSR